VSLYLYLNTTGRVTGQPREIEIRFAEHGGRQLAATVKALFDAKYGWSDGLMLELTSA
jgi:hypothetical protein